MAYKILSSPVIQPSTGFDSVVKAACVFAFAMLGVAAFVSIDHQDSYELVPNTALRGNRRELDAVESSVISVVVLILFLCLACCVCSCCISFCSDVYGNKTVRPQNDGNMEHGEIGPSATSQMTVQPASEPEDSRVTTRKDMEKALQDIRDFDSTMSSGGVVYCDRSVLISQAEFVLDQVRTELPADVYRMYGSELSGLS